jgi:hypothetical protein
VSAGTKYEKAPLPAFMEPGDREPLGCERVAPEVFFPEKETRANTSRAKAICSHCPNELDCRAWALDQPADPLFGVWGGTTRNQRIAYARNRKAVQ